MMNYFILFFWALGASTILPLSSEATLIYYIEIGLNPVFLLISAGVGNTLGSIINYYLGKKGTEYLIKKDKLSIGSVEKYQKTFGRFGGWSLLLSWMPIIGDPLTMIAGAADYPLWKFVVVVTIAKFGRYAILIGVMEGYQNLFIFIKP
jgi:membrane protein YqaA with SNARE-associated domain